MTSCTSSARKRTTFLQKVVSRTSISTSSIEQLKKMTPQAARDALRRLCNGYSDKSCSGYGPVIKLKNGCWLCQKRPTRKVNGYIQIAPIAPAIQNRAKKGEPLKEKPLPQHAHQLCVKAFHDKEDVDRLYQDGWHASHRCGQPTCINHDHIVMEPKPMNDRRRACRQV
ncbi:hypothetical protein LX36DRAFT_189074 [Colletotrichum falcatum]|nr:hypothetical protein LX36DRAFT_189074 [Colletotrichum falcatum]